MGTNDIRGGIARVREWLALGFIKIMAGACPNLLEEAQRYHRPSSEPVGAAGGRIQPRHGGTALPGHGPAASEGASARGEAPTAQEKQAAEIQAQRRYLWETPAVWRDVHFQ